MELVFDPNEIEQLDEQEKVVAALHKVSLTVTEAEGYLPVWAYSPDEVQEILNSDKTPDNVHPSSKLGEELTKRMTDTMNGLKNRAPRWEGIR